MKKDEDIVEMLECGKKFSLSSNELDSIKFTLLEHANKTLSYENSRSWNFVWLKHMAPAFAVVMIVFMGTAYASQDSLPGSPLYAMKVNVVEEMVLFTKINPEDRTQYDLSLMEARLDELKILVSQNRTPESEALDSVAEQIDEHVADITETLAETEENEFTHEEKIGTLSKLSGVSKAQSDFVEEEGLTSIADTVDDSHEEASDSLESAIEDFSTERGDADVADFLSDQISSVSDQLNASTTEDSVRAAAADHLQDMKESLTEGDTVEALISIFEVQQEIDSEEYLDEKADELIN